MIYISLFELVNVPIDKGIVVLDYLREQPCFVLIYINMNCIIFYKLSYDILFLGSIYASATTWNDIFPGNDPLLNGISMIGWSKPSKIQGEALPQIVNPDQHDGTYRHLKAQAHHGSGKTGTFALAMLSRCDFKNPNTQAICVCPTRELALQIAGVVDSLGRYLDVKVCRAVPEARSHEEIKLSSSEKRLMTAPIVVGTVGQQKPIIST